MIESSRVAAVQAMSGIGQSSVVAIALKRLISREVIVPSADAVSARPRMSLAFDLPGKAPRASS